MSGTAWIAADWGTSNLRLWAMGDDGTPVSERRSDRGMGTLSPDEFEGAFLDLAGDLIGDGPCDVVICGMAGARQGWVEAAYTTTPCAPIAETATRVPTRDPRLNVRILPGLCQMSPPDVMRGEETQIAGYLAGAPDFDGVICLPGTHSKWARVSGGMVQTFRTFMTGELFHLTATQSILRHSIGKGWDHDAFPDAVAQGFNTPGRVTTDLFSLRAASLVGGTDGATIRARLSGLLMGIELNGAQDLMTQGDVVLIGAPDLCDHYEQAIRAIGGRAQRAEATAMTLAGLIAAHDRLKEDQT
ncbi:2-dehydro-3-deoxygalactonokinase [Rhodovulum sp. FJ3]|uniref:2-dehydro-3-deoxygalactonokinase n=1 Tax=Rhodovulum sp. FJ3 TaxID=3079053 RepID=UPI00293DF94F|nr:2-dehydro-3-deoxygalactonokinase [Rhodovulum sp. FJ3]MDV4169234.1 2-dehydro-3-deoxygalactonokinase [Rhodovulum sp. FJ3]